MVVKTSWYLDSCPSNPPCLIEDDITVKPCAIHKLLGLSNDELLKRVKDLNQIKSKAYNFAAEEIALPEGNTIPFRVDENDIIHITLNISANRKAQLQARIDTTIGVGKVVIE